MKKIILILILLLNIQCTSQMQVNEIEFNQAQNTTPIEYFCKMMQNKPEKIAKNNYYIIQEKQDYIFYGKIKSKMFSSSISEILKVNKIELIQEFPMYKELEGYKLQDKAIAYFIEKNQIDRKELNINDVKFYLKNYIEIEIDYTLKKQKNAIIYLFDKKTLELIE